MKLVLISDIHLGAHNLEIEEWLEVSERYFFEFFFPNIQKIKGPFKVFILGDLFDNRTFIDLRTITLAYKIFDEFERLEIPVHILIGNHDILGEYDYRHCSCNILKNRYNNITFYYEPKIIEEAGVKIGMMPWFTDKKEEKEQISNWAGKIKYLFGHTDIAGFKNNLRSRKLQHGHSTAEFINFHMAIFGHIHLRDQKDKILYLGSPYELDRNDRNNIKGIHILDLNTDKIHFIENTFSPRYRELDIKTEEDFDKISETISEDNNDRWDIIIDHSVLAEKPNLKRKLDEFARKRRIEKVNQRNDIELDDKIDDVELDDIGVTLSVTDMIREYIKKQNYNKDRFKDAILNELEESIDILNSELS